MDLMRAIMLALTATLVGIFSERRTAEMVYVPTKYAPCPGHKCTKCLVDWRHPKDCAEDNGHDYDCMTCWSRDRLLQGRGQVIPFQPRAQAPAAEGPPAPTRSVEWFE